jgi:DNA-binding transcriptional LysR family regulator
VGSFRTGIDPTALALLAAVARAGGIRAGALQVGLPRSTVSRLLADFERSIGTRLIVRTSRRFRLTDLGRALADQGERIEELARTSEQLVRRSSVEPSGILRVAVAPLLGEAILPAVLAEYLRLYPRMRVDLSLSPDYVDLRRSGIDVALRSGAMADATDLFVVRLGRSVSGCFASPAYLKAHGTPTRPADLSSHDCILVGGEGTTWTFRERRRDVAIEVNVRVRLNDFRVATAAAEAGIGIVRVARFHVAGLVKEKRLVPVLEKNWVDAPVFAVHTAQRPAPAKIHAFIELARRAAAEVLEPSA